MRKDSFLGTLQRIHTSFISASVRTIRWQNPLFALRRPDSARAGRKLDRIVYTADKPYRPVFDWHPHIYQLRFWFGHDMVPGLNSSNSVPTYNNEKWRWTYWIERCREIGTVPVRLSTKIFPRQPNFAPLALSEKITWIICFIVMQSDIALMMMMTDQPIHFCSISMNVSVPFFC